MVNRLYRPLLVILLLTTAMMVITRPGYGSKSVSATLNENQIPVDMAAVLTITVEGGQSVDINMPEVKHLRFHRRGQSSQVQMINGSFSSSIATVYLVEPLEPGDYTIPPITVYCDGEELLTQPVSFTATAKSNTQSQTGDIRSSKKRIGSGKGAKLVFLKAQVQKETVYSGEMIPVRIEAYFNRKIQANLLTLPKLVGDGFVLSPLSDKPSRSMKQVDNSRYIVLGWTSFLTGIKEGSHPLHFELQAELLMPQRSRMFSRFRNQGLFQDDLFDDFFNDYQAKTVNVASPDLTLETVALPTEGRPINFSGAIGNFSLEVAANPDDVEIGEPITLTMSVQGTGNFDRVVAPYFPESKKWKKYSPSVQFEPENKRPDKGAKRFEQAIVAQDPTITEIPPLSLNYFDPVSGRYKEMTSDPIPLSIRSRPGQSGSPQLIQTSPQEQKEDTRTGIAITTNIEGLAPLKLRQGIPRPTIRPLFQQNWFILTMAMCGCLLLALVTIGAVRRQQQRNPERQLRATMKKRLGHHLKKIDQARSKNDSREFLALCRSAIQEQLGLHWQTEAAAITANDLEQRLEPGSSLITVFQMADQAAYGGLNLSAKEMDFHYSRIQEELGALL